MYTKRSCSLCRSRKIHVKRKSRTRNRRREVYDKSYSLTKPPVRHLVFNKNQIHSYSRDQRRFMLSGSYAKTKQDILRHITKRIRGY